MSLRKLLRLRHTLAFRLTLWYAGIFTISSCVAFIFFYLLITSVFRERTDRDLLDQAGAFSSILAVKGLNAVKHVIILESQAAGEKKIFFRLLYPSGVAFSSSNMSYWKDIHVGRPAIRRLVEGRERVFETVVIPERKDKVRILYSIIGNNVILQLGQSMEGYARFIEAFKKIFVTTMSVLFISAALIGWFMARQALSGVGEITRTARHISGGALEKRVPVQGRDDEIDQLASTFNQMLDRIETLVTGIKEMSDNIAHDLRSPVTRIRGIAEVTLTTGKTLDEYENMAANTIEECDRLLDMINTMLIISKTEAGVGKLEPVEINMTGLVRDACNLFRPIAEDKGVILACNVEGTDTLNGDIRMVQRMIANLIDNAIKYTPEGGTVDVSVHSGEREGIAVTVRDTGIGISRDDLPHVFDRFYRCDPSRSQAGIGLGLSLAQAVARAHGGHISVTSTPDKGSAFTVTLPWSIPA